MKRISIYKDFQEDDLATDSVISGILDKLTIDENNTIEIDLRDCFIDYPYTSRIMDRLLLQLSNLQCDKRTLVIIYDLNAKEETLLNWIFLESEFLEIKNGADVMDLNNLKQAIEKKIREKKISIEIKIQYKEGSDVLNTFTYA